MDQGEKKYREIDFNQSLVDLGYFAVLIEELGGSYSFTRNHANILGRYLDLLENLFLFTNNNSFAQRHEMVTEKVKALFKRELGFDTDAMLDFIREEKEYLKKIQEGVMNSDIQPESIDVFLSRVGVSGNMAGGPWNSK